MDTHIRIAFRAQHNTKHNKITTTNGQIQQRLLLLNKIPRLTTKTQDR
jgi:hypothetical protein